MSMSKHLVEYTFRNRFLGIESEFARELDMDRSNLGRDMERLQSGGECAKLVMKTLDMYGTNPVDLYDLVFHFQPEGGINCAYQYVLDEVQTLCLARNAHARGEKLLEKWRQDMLVMVERFGAVYCGKNTSGIILCNRFREPQLTRPMPSAAEAGCPSVPLITFMRGLDGTTKRC